MGYSIHSTGIPAIDDQHRAIDALIARYRNASDQREEQECLTALADALQRHFRFIESFFDVKFPAEFQQRQTEILTWLSIKIQQRFLEMISQETLAEEIGGMFLYNVNSQGGRLQGLHSW